MAVPVLNEDTETTNLIRVLIHRLEEMLRRDIHVASLPPQPPRPPPPPEAQNMLQFSSGRAAVVAGQSMSTDSWTKCPCAGRLPKGLKTTARLAIGISRSLRTHVSQLSGKINKSCREDLSKN
ncbi:uncharacterized protein LOC135937324 [Cloeon dipterum]|uniref:uncharacterized protein LOC135937324 n=1 Tax=Cloeon dipterum TaxID=197152 RepID=UPI00321F99D7